MPDGLYLAGVKYPEPYRLPAADPSASFFHGVFTDDGA
jgi:tRNA pseudouridine38-40 synthase